MRQRALYDHFCVYVCPDSLSNADFVVLECCLRDGGAVLESDADVDTVTHVVCHPAEYARFVAGRSDRFYGIMRPEWVYRTFLLQKCIPVDKFSADPLLFFSTLAIAAGSIDKDPRKVIDGLIGHFGGQIIEDSEDTSGATHVLSADGAASAMAASDAQRSFQVAYTEADVERQVNLWKQWLDERPASLDFSLPGCVVAHLGKGAGLHETHHVNYAWIEECVRRKQKLDEAPFSKTSSKDADKVLPSWKTRPDSKVEELNLERVASMYLNARTAQATATGELAAMRKVTPERLAAMQKTLAGAIVLVAQHIPSQLKDVLAEILKAAKAKVANVPLGKSYTDIVRKVVTNASFVVCRYQSGLEYEEALRQKKQIRSVYWVLASLGVPSDGGDLRESLLQPVKSVGGVSGMESFVVTLSGFSSRTLPTREDVQMAIQATGACVLPVLSRSHSTHLLCFEAKGEKFKKAQSWNFDNILSHEWLLACLTQWKYVPEALFRMGDGATTSAPPPPASAEKDDVTPPASETETTTKPASSTTSEPETKASAGRFDVGDILDELDEPTPKSKKGRRGALKSGKAAAAATDETSTTPTATATATATGKRSLRRTSTATGGDVEMANSIPEDFEFQFGKKAKATKGKANATGNRVMFEEPEPEKDKESRLTKSSRKSPTSAKNGATEPSARALTLITDEEEEEEEEEKEGTNADAKKTVPKKSPASARKRKTAEPSTPSASIAASTAETSNKKKKQGKDTTPSTNSAVASTSTSSSSGGRLFLLTGSREACAINESLILALGGQVSQIAGRIYDPRSTHIISSELKRTEKFIAGCAAGKWILKQSYLDASSEAGHFVDEAAHEWGASEADMDQMDPRIWPPVAAFWRKARAAAAPGAFAGWKFLVHPKTVPPADMCERIITASGGELISLTSELDLSAFSVATSTKKNPVVALVHTDLSSRDVWLKKFKTHKVRCIKASFLIDYLTKDQTNRPKLDDYVL